ncbi:hypothetical protein KP509_26G070000 [Ceratopteris richardii]|uniref:Uncharacterized protein n=1 Tax=Ceratopteris richardii TaxID=49495 RepID=A0A8T2RPR8_CERRI|nr:hypothetical protein KP509_26G070000 [Ceratopteris richardii]
MFHCVSFLMLLSDVFLLSPPLGGHGADMIWREYERERKARSL